MNSTSDLLSEANAWVAERIASFQEGTTVPEQHLLQELQHLFPSIELNEQWLSISIIKAWQETKTATHQRTPKQWAEIFPRYPILKDGFALAFQLDQTSEILDTLQEFGLVVVHVLNDEECMRSRKAICEEINAIPLLTRKEPIDWQKPWTWENWNWPMNGKFLESAPAFHQQAFNNRTHETIYHVFSTIWNENYLMVNTDRWGIARGTLGLLFPQPDGSFQKQDREDWRLELTKHWDYNPWLLVQDIHQGIAPGYQGLIAFVDQDIDTGCHLTLPSCVRFLEQWCQENTPPPITGTDRVSFRPKHDDPILQYMQAIPIRQGDLLIWSWGQLHSTIPNRSASMRLHQYIRMFPAKNVNPFYTEHEKFSLEKMLIKYRDVFSIESIELSGLGKKLLGLESWT
jgi:hypothetical protein